MFKKILIANRGEIAVRVIRACREMGIKAVAVYSEADREALHVRMADEARLIGPPAARESYLSIERILDAARDSGAEAIHPGYGFLSENPSFPEACERTGIVFIGPGAGAMRLMGHKVAARKAMIEARVPVVPGSEVLPEDPAAARTEAERVIRAGLETVYPILLKAAAGGGGKGMRVVASAAEFESAYAQARSEAQSSFGNPSVYAEKYISRPRHIEVQILADATGTTLHLGERECTIQRRHQKLIEECPSPVVDAATRARLGEMAVKAARAAAYVGAGTCEFLRDESGAFYFMEMNARLQVEHPVTEMVTGLDLVKLQIRIAMGEPIPFKQEQVIFRGWAIECRIFAEDPARNFMPSPGRIGTLRLPAGPGIRDDGGVYQSYTVPVHYDPMISKLIAWGQDRDEAIARMRRALDEYRIQGVRTTIPFHRRVFRHPAFLAADFDTSFVETHRDALMAKDAPARPRSSSPAAGARPDERAQRGLADRSPAKGGPPASPGHDPRKGPAPYDTLPPGLAKVQGETSSGESVSTSERRSSGHEEDTGPLSTAEVAVITTAIAAYRRSRASAGEASTPVSGIRRAGESGQRASGQRPQANAERSWRLTGRLEGLRDR